MKKQATILGFYHFDALDLGSYKKTNLIFWCIAFIVLLSLLFLYVEYFLFWFFSMAASVINIILFIIIILIVLCILFKVSIYISNLPKYALAKVNADDKLKEFNLERESGILKKIEKKDIKINRYFSALGYWELYFENERMIEKELIDKQNKEIEDRYPNVFSDSEQN